MRKFYTNANMLIRKFFKCSVDVKCYLFKTYCSTMYCSAMWFDTTKSAMKKLKVAYNNSLRRLLSLPTYNSASEMFAVLNIPSNLLATILRNVIRTARQHKQDVLHYL